MIIVNLKGGLGNQMFQYALGCRLAIERGVLLKLDLSWYLNQNLRKFELDKLNTQFIIATEKEVSFFRYYSKNPVIRKIISFFQYFLPYYQQRVVKELNENSFDPNILKVPANCFLMGYWQSEKYFLRIREELHHCFSPRKTPDYKNTKLAEKIKSHNSISLHVRRGDYFSDKKTFYFHGVCSVEYYQAAINFMLERVESPNFYVFSDEKNWAKRNLNLPANTTIVDQNLLVNDYLDLWLMSQCKHNIIANSSFSWWGAWLNQNNSKIVIAPKLWFSNNNLNTADLIPSNWMRI